ncbi:monovalent cation/H+ antiporter complex subunit F [Melittangium boletus]|uniref:Multiple resistance and pH regulation protein F n=1 Tax=Melittangium boletus DSM 14713 TaxID=1294270 RepID=A0A250IFP0_9BACT|nr:monovalent cation/H+ antiporter complex subunit F [Melittangium boletus]ATB29746.1 multiple resistance and pH regulation protein F [Melittangium boletus DSM 14713]
MHDGVFYVALVWLMGLLAVLVVLAVKARSTLDVVLALDTLGLVFVAVLGLFSAWRGITGYLDAALVLALVSYVQTVAATRLHTGQKARPR